MASASERWAAGEIREGGRSAATAVATAQAIGLVALMVVVSVAMWVGMPLGWIYLAANHTPAGPTSFAVLGGLLTAITLSALAMLRVLTAIDRAYCRATSRIVPRLRHSWLKSLSDCRGSSRPSGPLEAVMVGSVLIAFGVVAVWFLSVVGDGLGSYLDL